MSSLEKQIQKTFKEYNTPLVDIIRDIFLVFPSEMRLEVFGNMFTRSTLTFSFENTDIHAGYIWFLFSKQPDIGGPWICSFQEGLEKTTIIMNLYVGKNTERIFKSLVDHHNVK